MRYGYFDDKAREYVITRPDTPLPWINYLGSEAYFGLISNTAGGYSFYKDARLRRLTRYRYNNVPLDSGGRYLYIRDVESGKYWSPTWQPTYLDLEDYNCRHGLGYSTISSTYAGIHTQVRYFVPLAQNLEIWQTTVTNHRDQAANLSIFSLIEFCLWDAWDDSTNFQRNFSIGEVEVEDGIIYHKTEYRERRDHFAFFACSEPVTGFDTQRDAFLGPYQTWANPAAVVEDVARNSIAYGWAPIGSHQVRLSLALGETKEIIFLLGYQENPTDEKFDPPQSSTVNKRLARPIIDRYLDGQKVTSAFHELKSYWDKLLTIQQVQSPDEHTDRMVNIWNAYQCMVTFNLSRSASYFESGIGRGMGYRDSNQDLMGFVHMVPMRARERILDLAATQLESGGAYHQYQPLTKRGNDAVGGGFNDDPLWLILGVTAYIKECGDLTILEEQVPYDNRPGSETSLYEHLRRSLSYTLERLGPHGLPLIGRADWNDCLNLNTFSSKSGESFQTTTSRDGQTAESVFIAGLFVLAAREMVTLAERYGRLDDAVTYREEAERLATTTLTSGWDGEWFLRAYDDYGSKIGSKSCTEGQIFIEPQGICIMAGIGDEGEHRQSVLSAVHERLATPHGIVLQQPAYSKYYLELGEISTYPPGYKENAGIFCHTNPWIMIAEAMAGNGDQAHDYYSLINPSVRESISEVHRCEPYVYAQMIAGCDAPTFGEAKNSWLSGTAAWNYVAITQWILGVRPTYDGLIIDPCIPRSWPGFTVQRQFRGVQYEIEVRNPNRVCRGVRHLVVDDRRIAGNIVPILNDGQLHRVIVELG